MRTLLIPLFVLCSFAGCGFFGGSKSSSADPPPPLTRAEYRQDMNTYLGNIRVGTEKSVKDQLEPINRRLETIEEKVREEAKSIRKNINDDGDKTRSSLKEYGDGLARSQKNMLDKLCTHDDQLTKIQEEAARRHTALSAGDSGSAGTLTLKSRPSGNGLMVEKFEVPASIRELDEFMAKQAAREREKSEEGLQRLERMKMMDALIKQSNGMAQLDNRVSAIDQQLQEAITRFESKQSFTQDGVTKLGTRIESLHEVVEKVASAFHATVVDRAPVPVPTTGYIQSGHWKIFRRGNCVHVW